MDNEEANLIHRSVGAGAPSTTHAWHRVRRGHRRSIAVRVPVCALLLSVVVVGCSFGRSPAVDDNVVMPLPAGLDVIARNNTACGGIDDPGGAWRDLVIRPTQDAEAALATLRAHLESKGFRLGPGPGPTMGQWPSTRGATEVVGIELGTAADYARDSSQVGPNPAVVRASGAHDLVLRIHPAQADCMT
jgi:hypothetical protein